MYNTATKYCTAASTARLSFCRQALSRPIFGSGFRGKQKVHGCTSSADVMVRTAAEEERDAKELFKSVKRVCRGV